MSKPVGRIIGQWAGVGASVAIAGAGIVALRHALETPQPLKSVLPGEAHLYHWRRRSIFYKVSGSIDAPPLVLLHRPDPGSSGHEMLHIMAPLSQTYRVYALDLLGFGLSDRPSADYSAALYCALCQDFLRDVVQRPATLAASGLSCNYAVALAASSPELCTDLVLISPLALQGEQQPSPLKQYVEAPLIKALLYPLLSTHLAFLLTRRIQQESGEDFPQFYANTHQLGAEHASMARLAGRLSENVERQFETLQQSVLMIWGTRALDNQQIVAGLHRTAVLANPERLARKVELIQDAALEAHNEQPEAVIAAIKHWQAEIHKDELPAPEETPVFTLHAADQQAKRASAVLAPADQSATPTPIQSNPAIRSADPVVSASLSTPSQADTPKAVIEKSTRAASVPARAQEAFKATISAPSASNKAEETTVETMDNSKAEKAGVIAYCVKCKQKRAMLNPREVIMKNGRPATRGVCPVCGTRLNRIGGIS